jgi:hypothetical protein
MEVVDADPVAPSGAVVIPVRTEPVGARPRVSFARIGIKQGDRELLVNLLAVRGPGMPPKSYQADAVFWSEAAVERFMLPYYASKHLHDGGRIAQEIVAMFHNPPSGAAGGSGPPPRAASSASPSPAAAPTIANGGQPRREPASHPICPAVGRLRLYLRPRLGPRARLVRAADYESLGRHVHRRTRIPPCFRRRLGLGRFG